MKKILLILFSFCLLFADDELVLDASNSFALTMRKFNQNNMLQELMQRSQAIVICPSVTKIGLVLGGMSGKGIMLVGSPYSPSEILEVEINGGSIGLQIGYENSALVLFILKDSIVNDIKTSKFTIKANASFAFGNMGENYGKISDFTFTNDIYAYASNEGFFAGASFGGAVISKASGVSVDRSSYGYTMLMQQISKFQ